MTQAIYSGLTSEEAFKIMEVTMQCRRELPTLERWSKQRHYAAGAATAIVACVAAYLLATTGAFLSEWSPLGISSVMGALVLLVTWMTARQTERRREYLRALNQGLTQFKDTATSRPGASAVELINAMPTTPF